MYIYLGFQSLSIFKNVVLNWEALVGVDGR